MPLEHVIETMRPLDVTLLSGAPAYVIGLATVRGRPTPVVSASSLISGRVEGETNRWVTLKLGARQAALAVDAVEGVRPLDTQLSQMEPLLGEQANDFVQSIAAVDAQLLLVLQASRLVPDEVWAVMDRQEAARAG